MCIRYADELVSAIQQALDQGSEIVKKYSFFVIEAIPMFDRSEANADIVVPGFQSLHSLRCTREVC